MQTKQPGSDGGVRAGWRTRRKFFERYVTPAKIGVRARGKMRVRARVCVGSDLSNAIYAAVSTFARLLENGRSYGGTAVRVHMKMLRTAERENAYEPGMW